MAAKVLDAYALMAFLEGEPGADLVRDLILKAEGGADKLLMTVVNLGEVWYAIARTNSPETADHYIDEIRSMAIEVVDADWQLARQAAVFKANGNIAYGDCFAAALAKLRGAEVVTGDKEFQVLENEIEILWLE
jgi:predicted nucleic acid-binding protein